MRRGLVGHGIIRYALLLAESWGSIPNNTGGGAKFRLHGVWGGDGGLGLPRPWLPGAFRFGAPGASESAILTGGGVSTGAAPWVLATHRSIGRDMVLPEGMNHFQGADWPKHCSGYISSSSAVYLNISFC